jgi:hypothetical protein
VPHRELALGLLGIGELVLDLLLAVDLLDRELDLEDVRRARLELLEVIEPWSMSVWPRTFVFMTGLRTNATGGIVRIAPEMAPRRPKPRKSPRVIGSFCNSAKTVPF